jgi:glutamyl-tRNA synthetase
MEKEVRVRFAPSPTGPLHIGGVRTALYNYLFARKNQGKFILRIEDTDRSRFVKGAERYIGEAFSWLGILADESVEKGGEYGPYRQSERSELYRKYVAQLLEEGKAYYAFDTSAELDEMRQRLKEAKADNQVYDSLSRQTMRNSLTLPEEEVQQLLDSGTPYVVRLKVERDQEVMLDDMIRGQVKVSSNNIDDKVLLKSDGMPTYHLANVIDDHHMKISHVIRGEEWLPSAPLHVLLYHYFGWEAVMPQFAHLPLLLKPDGNGKLSKRDADKHGYPVFPMDWEDPNSGEVWIGFREQGYLADAVINFLAMLGWNPGTEQELFSREELIEAFSIERINKAGAKFDIEKARWFNEQYLKKVDDDVLALDFLKKLEREGVRCEADRAAKICGLLKERVTFPHEFWEKGRFFFFAPDQYDEKVIKKKWNEEVKSVLEEYQKSLNEPDTFNGEIALDKLRALLESKVMGMGKVLPVLRVALTGSSGGPDLMGIMSVLGKEEVISRINTAIEKLDQ